MLMNFPAVIDYLKILPRIALPYLHFGYPMVTLTVVEGGLVKCKSPFPQLGGDIPISNVYRFRIDVEFPTNRYTEK